MTKPRPDWGVSQHGRIDAALRALGYPAPVIGLTPENEALMLIADALEDLAAKAKRARAKKKVKRK